MRRFEMTKKLELRHKEIVTSNIKTMYPQETDWTCSIACIRTLMSAYDNEVLTEEELVKQYNLQMGSHYSAEIKEVGMLNEYDAHFGCDNSIWDFDDILQMCMEGYQIMLETMINYSHWMVLLGYYPCADGDIEKSRLLLYDPYYDTTRLIRTDEFMAMWMDGDYENSGVKEDFIAIRKTEE